VLVLTVNAAQARTALFGPNGCAQRLGPRAVLIVAATIVLADARSLEGDPVARGPSYFDASVTGSATGGANGALPVMASGEPAAFAAARQVLDHVVPKVEGTQ